MWPLELELKERPILFSGPMVRAILAGTKTQTRRLVKARALEWLGPDMFTPEYVADPANGLCPYGVPGDRLWVRETWQENTPPSGYIYRADDVAGHIDTGWRPSIFMPRAACRIRLEVTDLRVQRLQDISEEDAKAEGVALTETVREARVWHASHRAAFAGLWEILNAKRAPWDSNPWTWAITFRQVA